VVKNTKLVADIYSQLSRDEKFRVLLSLLARLFLVGLDIVGIALIGAVVSLISGTRISSSSPFGSLVKWLEEHGVQNAYALILSTAVAFFIFEGVLSAFLNRITALYISNIEWLQALKVFRRLFSQPLESLERSTRETTIFTATHSVTSTTTKPLLIASTIVSEVALLLTVSAYLAFSNWLLFVSVGIFFSFVGWFMHRFVTVSSGIAARAIHKASLESQGIVLDVLANVRQLSLSPNRDTILNVFSTSRHAFARQGALYQTITGFPRYITEIAVLLGVGILVLERSLNPVEAPSASTIALFLAGIFRLVSSMIPLQSALTLWKSIEFESEGALDVLMNLDDPKSDSDSISRSLRNPVAVQVENLSYRYAGASSNALETISFDVPAGCFVAVTGKSGGGKSTLADLLLGLREPSHGRVLLDGIPARQFVTGNKGRVAYVPQQSQIYSGSIRQNVSLNFGDARQGEVERVYEVLNLVGLRDFSESTTDALQTILGDGGISISGGEAQRISLARALFTAPNLLVLDEATSALDSQTQTIVLNSILNLLSTTTVIAIAHRQETVAEADMIIKIDRGALA
jgi:ABC-type bacteriocin/lantibiotic exporter with double-glycine peptidase domain